MTFHIVTIFPESLRSYLETSILGKAVKQRKIRIRFYNPRDFTRDKHRQVDDKPYGGGAGMVLKAEPIIKTVSSIKSKIKSKKVTIVILSAKGKQFSQKTALNWSKKHKHIILITGRYEGIDERVRIALKAQEISIGPYVLTDGELPAMVLISTVTRLIPGVIKFESLNEESHFNREALRVEEEYLEYPHYTRPEEFFYKNKKYKVPKVLLSGDHKKIENWRQGKSYKVEKKSRISKNLL
jgi:tRNA (guanine37-N1)-methyltransferase